MKIDKILVCNKNITSMTLWWYTMFLPKNKQKASNLIYQENYDGVIIFYNPDFSKYGEII